MGGQDRSYLSLTFLISWICLNEHKNTWMTLKLLLEYSILIDCTCSQSLADLCSVTMTKVKVKKKSDISYIKQLPYLCLREKVLALIAPIQFKSIGSFDPFSKGGGSDSQVGVDVLEIGDTSNLQS